MELIEVELSEFTRRSRSLMVAHSETELTRGLEYGERILVRCGAEAQEYRTAVVVEIDFALEDTHYRLVIGGRIPVAMAADLIRSGPVVPGRRQAESADPITVAEVAELLARPVLGPRVPVQAQPREGRRGL